MVTLAGNPIKIEGTFPKVGDKAPEFALKDPDNHKYTFLDVKIGAGKYIKVRTGSGTDTTARMSGFSIRVRDRGPPGAFLILPEATASTRQSATAALITAMSAGKAASTAACISRAVSTQTRFTPTGAAKATGPDTSVTSAPSRARAPAMA